MLAFGDDEFAIVELSRKDGKTAASVIDTQHEMLGKAQVKQTEHQRR